MAKITNTGERIELADTDQLVRIIHYSEDQLGIYVEWDDGEMIHFEEVAFDRKEVLKLLFSAIVQYG